MLAASECELRRKPFFRELSNADMAAVEELKLGNMSIPANRDILQAGEVGGNVLIWTAGWGFRYKTWPEGKRQILDFLLPGDLIGLQSGLLGIVDHSVRSLTVAKLCAFDSRGLEDLFRNHGNVALALAKNRSLEERRMDARFAMVGRRSAVERLAFLFVDLLEWLGGEGGLEMNRCSFPLRRQHMADAVGLTGAHVNRTLNQFRRDRFATIERGVLTVGDYPALVRLSGYESIMRGAANLDRRA